VIRIKGHLNTITEATNTNVLNERVVNESPLGQKEGAAWAELMEKEQFLLAANLAMIALGSLLLQHHPFVELLFGGEGDPIHSLQTLSLNVALPIGRRRLQNFQCLHI
jgi:hypothetical protein